MAYGEATANLNSGSIGIKVRILPPNTVLPDRLTIKDQIVRTVKVEEVKNEVKEEEKVVEAVPKEKKVIKKKTVKKKTTKKKEETKEDENQE